MLHVKTSGTDDSLEDVKRYGLAVIEAAIAACVTKVCCDERELAYEIGALETFECAKFLAETVPSLCRVVIVCHPRDAQDGRFFETVAVNRGLRICVTSDFEAALAWIKS